MKRKSLFFLSLLFSLVLSTSEGKNFRWQQTHYVWNMGIAQACTIGLPSDPSHVFSAAFAFNKELYRHIKQGDIVWLHCKDIPIFAQTVLPKIKYPCILVINDGDESFPSDCRANFDVEEFIGNPKIIHIWAQNCDYSGPSHKVSPLPIGIDFHSIAYKGGHWGERGGPQEQEKVLQKIISESAPTYMRKKRAYVDFHLSDTMRGSLKRYLQFGEDRKTIFRKLQQSGLIDYATQRIDRQELWKIKSQYAFSVSPIGNGMDCHRTWEDLALGCIVIVKTSPLDPLFEGFPVVIVKDWSEVTEENFDKWLSQYADASTNPFYRHKLTNEYWINRIKSDLK